MSDYLDATNEELLKDYFSESEMMVDNLESNILAIENDPTNHDAIDEIFRAAHTLKGNSATVEFGEIAHFAHTMEDLLDAEVVEEEVGEMKIKGVFRTERSSIIAGGEVLTGKAA